MGFFETRAYGSKKVGSAKGGVWIDDAQVKRALIGVTRKVEDMRPFWTKLDKALQVAEEGYFSSEGGGTWAPLSPKYAEWKARNGGGELMVLSGALRQSLASSGGEHIFSKSQTWMKFGTRNHTGNLWKNRAGKQRNVLDGKSPQIQEAIATEVGKFADELGVAWRSGK